MNENLNQAPNQSPNQNLNQKPTVNPIKTNEENPKKKLGVIIFVTVVLVLGLIAIFAFSANKTNEEVVKIAPTDINAPINNVTDDSNLNEPITPVEETVICTMEVMQCPNGAYVGRVAPDCEFAACPILDLLPAEQIEPIVPVESAELAEEPVFCAMDVKECPGGNFVGRVAPDCDFAACPITE